MEIKMTIDNSHQHIKSLGLILTKCLQILWAKIKRLMKTSMNRGVYGIINWGDSLFLRCQVSTNYSIKEGNSTYCMIPLYLLSFISISAVYLHFSHNDFLSVHKIAMVLTLGFFHLCMSLPCLLTHNPSDL